MVRYFDSGEPFPLERGGELPALRIAYHTYGEPNAARDNVVWVCHALTANSDVADWWPHTVEEGRFLDPSRWFVVCANILGSHYGTTGPLHENPATGRPWYGDFPRLTIRDMVAAHRLLASALGIGRIAALVGSSVGGFQAVEWAVVAEHGNRHTASIFSKDVDHMTRFARVIETTIYVKNSATKAGVGIGGEGHCTMTIAGPTGEGITCAKSFCRRRRCMLAEGGLRII